MINIILQALYFMFPAYMANAVPNFLPHFKMGRVLDSPIDLGRKLFGVRIFGNNKTVKGVLFGTLFGVVTGLSQYYLANAFGYSLYEALIIGFLLGFGALVGDAVKSFIKRRVGIKPGAPFPVFDQIDFAIGALFFVSIAVDFSWKFLAVILIISPILPVIANIIAYFLKIKKVWW